MNFSLLCCINCHKKNMIPIVWTERKKLIIEKEIFIGILLEFLNYNFISYVIIEYVIISIVTIPSQGLG